jgi:hypothetical protein
MGEELMMSSSAWNKTSMNDQWYPLAILVLHIYGDNSQIDNAKSWSFVEYW